MRMARALVTFPKLSLLMSPLGLANCAWLNMLKNSPRISKDFASVTGITFWIPKSVLLMPGPWKKRRLAVPKLPQSGPVKTPEPSRAQAVAVNELWLKYVNVPGVARGLNL